jgi:hypothetical protein
MPSLEDNNFKRMSHPPSSPDIAPNDFYLFGTGKHRLQTWKGQSFEELQGNVREILGSLGRAELARLTRAWMDQLQNMIDLGGEVLKSVITLVGSFLLFLTIIYWQISNSRSVDCFLIGMNSVDMLLISSRIR